jgi:ferric-dicitrate binding protein FerR (iron transport regulator)
MANKSMPARNAGPSQQVWDRITAEAGLEPTKAKARRPLILGFGSTAVRALVVIGVVALAAYSFGRSRGPAPAGAAGLDRSAAIPARPLEGTKTYTAAAGDSMHVTMFNGSTAVLAPGSTLTVTPRPSTTPQGALADMGTLTGGARFDINPKSKRLWVQTQSGNVVLEHGVSELTVLRDTLIVRGITGNVFVRPGGRFSWKSVNVGPGFELRAPVGSFITGRWVKPISGAR